MKYENEYSLFRLRREGADQVKDELEEMLLKELNLEFNVQDLYRFSSNRDSSTDLPRSKAFQGTWMIYVIKAGRLTDISTILTNGVSIFVCACTLIREISKAKAFCMI